MPGGGVAGWSWHRRLLSRGGCWYARRVLGVPVRDLTGGFKCFRREVLEALDLSEVHADGFARRINGSEQNGRMNRCVPRAALPLAARADAEIDNAITLDTAVADHRCSNVFSVISRAANGRLPVAHPQFYCKSSDAP